MFLKIYQHFDEFHSFFYFDHFQVFLFFYQDVQAAFTCLTLTYINSND